MHRRKKPLSFWTILNSNFVLWVFSSLVLGGAGLVYNELKERSKLENERIILVKKLDTEISSRLIHLNDLLSLEYESLDQAGLLKVGLVLDEPLKSGYPINIFPEFSTRNFRVLLWELSQSVPDDQKPEIDLAYSCASKLISDIKLQDKMKRMLSDEELSKMPASEREMYMTGTAVFGGAALKIQFNEFLIAFNLKRWGSPLKYLEQNNIISIASILNNSGNQNDVSGKRIKPCE